VEDPGEPHDLPNPFASSKPQQSIPDVSSSTSAQPDIKARNAIRNTSRTGQSRTDRFSNEGKAEQTKGGDAKMDEMRSMLERLRETRQQEHDRP
jgi:hypothetical protein